MTNISDFASRLVAGFGAVALTAVLLVSSFASPQATTIATVLA